MEAIAGCSGDEVPDAGSRGGSAGLLEEVTALACRVIGADEAVVLLRGPAGSLSEVARHGRAGPRRGISARCPVVVDGESHGVLAVVASARLGSNQLELLGELAELAARSLEERDQ